MESKMPYTGSNATAAAADVASRAHNALDTAVDKTAPAVNRMVDKAHATIDQTKEKSTRMMEACAERVRAQPLMAIGIAAVVGYLAGRLMR